MFEFLNASLVIPLLAAHLMSMQLAAAGPLVCVLLEWRGRRPGCESGVQSARRLGTASWVGLLIGIVTGSILFVPFWWSAERDYATAFYRLEHKLWWGLGELVFYVFCLAAYQLMWRGSALDRRGPRIGHRVLAVVAATNLLYHFPPLMHLFSDIARGSKVSPEHIDADAYLQVVHDGPYIPATVHFWFAAFAVAGIAVLLLALRDDRDEISCDPSSRYGCSVALVATLLQLPVGLWLVSSLPAHDQQQLLGGDLLTSSMLALAFVAVLWLLQRLATMAFSGYGASSLHRVATVYLVLVLLMVGVAARIG